ncbi:MAG TPA: phosphoglucosamine mutase [Vicinamibacterales bacterium]|nr:phosphoglucosamine mutase [Vicinamibacterales bacterium]
MKLFGTDGIRGKAGQAPLIPETVARVGAALVKAFNNGAPAAHRFVIGRDTRESGTWIEEELARGLTAEGAAVVSAGVVPTPAVAYLARTEGFDAGIVISASHNPYEDNGIKVFGGSGTKLTEQLESAVEQLVADASWRVPTTEGSYRLEAGAERQDLCAHYVQHLLEILKVAGPLAGSRIVVDCANGATQPIAPGLFRDLGFEVETIGVTPNGRNINLDCGSTHLDGLAKAVVASKARLGVAFDGDGDRALFVDHTGRIVDGDAILLMSAIYLKDRGRLPGPAVVATVMSNIGLDIALRDCGIELIRTAVGDKYVMEEMVKRGLALGGEQSGHVILSEHLFTGDGLATALNVLRIMADTGKELSELAAQLVTYPQVLVNVRVKQKTDLNTVPAIAAVMERVEGRLAGNGRLLVRYSGTEPLLRIMLEGKDQDEIRAWADEIADSVRANLT